MSLEDEVHKILSDTLNLPPDFLSYLIQYQTINPVSSGGVIAPILASSGLVGATEPSRYVGATASGAPVAGTFQVGDFVVDLTGVVWICTVSGSPGTWAAANAPVSSVFGRMGVVVATSGDYTAAQVTNAADKASSSTQSFAGGVVSSNATEGVGYATGAGNTITQGSNRSTAVTINAPSGQITTHSATIGSTATASFQVNNSTVAATDGIVLTLTNGTNAFAWPYFVANVASTSFDIAYQNQSGGNSNLQLVFNFQVIKGVTS